MVHCGVSGTVADGVLKPFVGVDVAIGVVGDGAKVVVVAVFSVVVVTRTSHSSPIHCELHVHE